MGALIEEAVDITCSRKRAEILGGVPLAEPAAIILQLYVGRIANDDVKAAFLPEGFWKEKSYFVSFSSETELVGYPLNLGTGGLAFSDCPSHQRVTSASH